MTIPRQEAMLILGLLLLAGVVATLIKLYRARQHGLSLRMQTFLAIGAITIVLTSTFALIVMDRFKARGVVFVHDEAIRDAKAMAAFTARSLETTDTSLFHGFERLRASPSLSVFSGALEDTRLQVIDRRGSVLFDSLASSEMVEDISKRPEVISALNGNIDPVARRLENGRVATAVPIIVDDKTVGVVRAVKSIFTIREMLADTAPKVAVLALVLAFGAALAGMIIGRFMGVPIERLTRAAERVARGERQGALPSPRGREVKALTAAFQSMRNKLEQRHEIESLVADVSHELKNPVAAIRASAEVLEDAIINDTEAALNFSKRIIESSKKMESIIRGLLSLAQLEARGIGASVKPLDIVSIAKTSIDDLHDLALERGVEIESHFSGEAHLKGDAAWIRRAIDNLLINALHFAPEKSVVTVCLNLVDEGIEVTVTDSGPGIDPSLGASVFERFVTSRKAQGGTGLGMAIVRAVAEAHGGTAAIVETGPNGTTVAFTLKRVF